MHSGKTQNLGFLEVFKQFTAAKFEPMNELVIANSLLRAEFDFEQDFTRSRDYQDQVLWSSKLSIWVSILLSLN